MRLSVVIPLFNYESYIGSAIESVLASTRAADEIIVVDDGSTDGSVAVVSALDGIRLVQQRNQGMSAAVTRGVEEAVGDVIVLLDADDTMAPDRLVFVERAFATDDVVMAWNPLWIMQAQHPTDRALPEMPLGSGTFVEVFNGGHPRFPMTSGIAVRRSTFLSVAPIPSPFSHCIDSYLARRASGLGRVVSSERPLGWYRVHSGSDSRRVVDRSPAAVRRFLGRRLTTAVAEHEVLLDTAHAAGLDVGPEQLFAADGFFVQMAVDYERLGPADLPDAHGALLTVANQSRAARRMVARLRWRARLMPRRLYAHLAMVRLGSDPPGRVGRAASRLYWRALALQSSLRRRFSVKAAVTRGRTASSTRAT